MSSRILYDAVTNQILRCQPENTGVNHLPPKEVLMRSARIPDGFEHELKTVEINETITNFNAIEKYRIVDGKGLLKPTIKIMPGPVENLTAEITFDIINTIDSDNISNVEILINDTPVIIEFDTEDLIEKIEFEFPEPGFYTIDCRDNNFYCISAFLEVH